jgi:hypothetical protein
MTRHGIAPVGAEQAIEQIAADIESYRDGGPDKETEHIQLGARLGFEIEAIKAQWKEARQLRHDDSAIQTVVQSVPGPEVPADRVRAIEAIIPQANASSTSEKTAPASANSPFTRPARQVLAFQHTRSPAGIPATLENAMLAIDALKIDCRYDVFHDRIIVKGHASEVGGDVLENLENVTLKVRQAVLKRFNFDPSTQFTFDALKLRCLDRVFDPVRDYLDALEWDGSPRIDRWLARYCQAEDRPLTRGHWSKDVDCRCAPSA